MIFRLPDAVNTKGSLKTRLNNAKTIHNHKPPPRTPNHEPRKHRRAHPAANPQIHAFLSQPQSSCMGDGVSPALFAHRAVCRYFHFAVGLWLHRHTRHARLLVARARNGVGLRRRSRGRLFAHRRRNVDGAAARARQVSDGDCGLLHRRPHHRLFAVGLAHRTFWHSVLLAR